MAVSNNKDDSILMGRDARGYFVVARGAIRAGLCYPLREALLERIDGPEEIPAVFVELSACAYMDSTFIGLLVAMDRKLAKRSGARVHVLNATAGCVDILRQLGLTSLLLLEERPLDAPAEMYELSSEKERPATQFILDAHQALMDTSEEARKKFGLLKRLLEKKLKSEKSPRDKP